MYVHFQTEARQTNMVLVLSSTPSPSAENNESVSAPTTFLVQLNDSGECEVRTHSKGLGRFDFTDGRGELCRGIVGIFSVLTAPDRELFQLALRAALDGASQGRIAAN